MLNQTKPNQKSPTSLYLSEFQPHRQPNAIRLEISLPQR